MQLTCIFIHTLVYLGTRARVSPPCPRGQERRERTSQSWKSLRNFPRRRLTLLTSIKHLFFEVCIASIDPAVNADGEFVFVFQAKIRHIKCQFCHWSISSICFACSSAAEHKLVFPLTVNSSSRIYILYHIL